MKKKRPVGSPSGSTPGKPSSKVSREACNSRSRKSLSFGNEVGLQSEDTSVRAPWTDREIKSLVQYIALFCDLGEDCEWVEKPWPHTKSTSFWDSCAEAIAEHTGLPIRSGSACRSKVTKKLSAQYRSVDEAEEKLGINYFGDDKLSSPNDSSLPETHSSLIYASPVRNPIPKKLLPGNFLESVAEQFKKLSACQRLQLLTQLYEEVAIQDFSEDLKWFIPKDFVKLSLHGMQNLQSNGKSNTIFHLCKCIGEVHPDGSTTRMPIMRMPFGLISYNCEFFSRDDVTNLHASEDYIQWMETMYAHFGNKWACLHSGPMWSYDKNENDEETMDSESINENVVAADGGEGKDQLAQIDDGSIACDGEEGEVSAIPDLITQAMLSADCLTSLPSNEGNEKSTMSRTADANRSVSLIWSGITADGIPEYREEASVAQALENQERHGVTSANYSKRVASKRDPLTILALTAAKKSNPNGRWWIKADGTDMKMGLRESVKNEWSGDCDLGDGSLQVRIEEYHNRLSFVQCIGVKERKEKTLICQDLEIEGGRLLEEKEFLEVELKKAETVYQKKKKQSNLSEESLFALAWDIEEYEKLISKNADIRKLISNIKEMLSLPGQEGNLARALRGLRDDLKVYVKNVTMKKRQAASHLLIFMISDEQRKMKPYAIPVRVLPYKSITDATVRQLRDELRKTMQTLGMVVVGFSTDGEFNSLRTRGSTRPVSVVQLKTDARSEARSTSVRQIEQFLFPIVGRDNSITTRAHHNAVPREDVLWLHSFMQDNNVPFEKAIHILRRTHFPFNYDPYPWIPGSEETKNECLKSLMATYLFRQKVAHYESLGVNFREHLYVPEVDSTGVDFHEREDHNHLLKRIAACTRSGGVPGINLRCFTEALNDPTTGLTYTALTGQHKQSVPDCERLLSPAMAKFMKSHGYTDEARFIEIVSNWHKASDGRGLTEQQRQQYNQDMLDYILEDWIPWCAHQEQRDYSTLDVNRPLKGIRGFTREIIVALIANIESQEKRRADCETKGLPPEHPRASSTDDVEGYIATLHQLIGVIFDHKTFRDNNRKITQEFTKRVDPDLPFYYWTGVNERYHCGSLKSFNEPSKSGTERLDRVTVSRRADPGVFVAGRATLPQRGTLTVRAQFHAAPERLPPRVADSTSST